MRTAGTELCQWPGFSPVQAGSVPAARRAVPSGFGVAFGTVVFSVAGSPDLLDLPVLIAF